MSGTLAHVTVNSHTTRSRNPTEAWGEAWRAFGERPDGPRQPAMEQWTGDRPTAAGAVRSAGLSSSGLPSPMAKFLKELNKQRSRTDSVIVGLLVAVTINTVKYRHHLHASDFLHLAASMTLALALYPWSRRLPSHYQRWREVVCCVLRVYLTIMPLFRPLALLIGTQVCRRTGLQERLVLFTAGTAFISHGVRLAILGLALPIRAGAHAALQLALVLLAAQQNEQTCRVVLTAGASLAGIRGESAAGPLSVPGSSSSTCSSSGCMHSPEEELAAAAVSGMMRVQFSAVSFVSMWLRPALPLPPQLSVAQQCRCLLGMYLFFLGFLVPVLVPMLVESRMYAEHRSGQGHSGGQEGTVPPEEKCVMARVYVAVWRCVERMNAPTLACAALLVLAVTWEAITTTVWRSSVLPHMYSDV